MATPENESLDPHELADLLQLPFPMKPSDPAPLPTAGGQDPRRHWPQLASLYRHPTLAGEQEAADALLAGAEEIVVDHGTEFGVSEGVGGLFLLLDGRAKLLHSPMRVDFDGRPTRPEKPSLLGWLGPGCWLGLERAVERIIGPMMVSRMDSDVQEAISGMDHYDDMRVAAMRFYDTREAEIRKILADPWSRAKAERAQDDLRKLYVRRRNFSGVMGLANHMESGVRFKVLAQPHRFDEGARVLSIPEAHVEEVFAEHQVLKQWLVQQIFMTRLGIPFVRELLESHPLFSNADADQRAFLASTAAYSVYRSPGSDETPRPWLPARRAGGRVALMIDGQGQSYLRGRSRKHNARLVGTFGPGELLGHEDLVTAEDFEGFNPEIRGRLEALEAGPAVGRTDLEEPARRTELYLGDHSVILEWDWSTLRRALSSTPGTWYAAVRYAQRGCLPLRQEPVPIYAVIGRAGASGVTTTAYGLAIALSRREGMVLSRRDEVGPLPVTLIDFDGEETFRTRWKPRGFERDTFMLPLSPDSLTGECRGQIEVSVLRRGSTGSDLPDRIRVVWAKQPQDASTLITLGMWSDRLKRVVVAGGTQQHPWWQELRDTLNQNDVHVVWVTNEPGAQYDATSEVPGKLIRVDRVDANYRRLAAERARAVVDRWRTADDPPASPALLTTGHMRLLDDQESADQLWDCRIEEVWARAGAPGLAQDLDRLVRLVEGESVGVALAGGGILGCCHMALIDELELAGVPIDYVAGSSIGAVVGALYAAGGRHLLDRMLEEHSPRGFEDVGFLRAFYKTWQRSPFVRSLTTGALRDTTALGELMDALGREVYDGEDMPLECTRIPFYPVSANLNSQAAFTSLAGTLGLGVRASAGMPPSIPGLWRNGERLLDGALVANVPSFLLRSHGADFMIASNVMRPPLGRQPERMPKELYNATFGRVEDVVKGIFLLAWKAGDDQGRLDANHLVDFRTEGAWLIDWWRGWRLRERAREQLVASRTAARISVHWAKRESWSSNQVDRIDVDVNR